MSNKLAHHSFMLMLLLGIFGFQQITAQKSFTEGSLLYNISIISAKSETPDINALNGATLELLLKTSQSRTEMKSTLGTESTVYDNRLKKGFILKEYSGQKLMISMNEANWIEKNRLYASLKFTITEDRTMVANYSCKKATATLPDGKMFTVYFNPDITLVNKTYNNAFPQLPGLPVQYEMQSGNISFRCTLSKISYDAIASIRFEPPKAGFRIMTYEENQQLRRNQ
jgi:GLPGLI family protein